MRTMRPILRRAAAGILLGTALVLASPVHARSNPDPPAQVLASDLPREARDVLGLIRAGGPFRHERDGVRFGNRERLLPARSRDYYHEYTVRTPGVSHRGARRIVCGGPVRVPEICFYTADHYQSFARIRE